MDPQTSRHATVARRVRLAMFDRVIELAAASSDGVLSRADLLGPVEVEGHRIPLMAGTDEPVWTPLPLDEPLSMRASVAGHTALPHAHDQLVVTVPHDTPPADADPRAGTVRALGRLTRSATDVVYLVELDADRYVAAWPVRAVDTAVGGPVRLDDAGGQAVTSLEVATVGDTLVRTDHRRRCGATVAGPRRLHQQAFRHEVLRAYQYTCAMCGLRRRELIDVAQIVATCHPRSRPVVTNGLALCVMHHAAFDNQLVGVDPAGTIHVRGDVDDEVDRPMLRPGLQLLTGQRLRLPPDRRDGPDRERLAARFAQFRDTEEAT